MSTYRTVLLQDSVKLKKEYPTLAIWSHPIFTSPEYESFARESEAVSLERGNEDPKELLLARAMPDMNDTIKANFRNVDGKFANVDQQFENVQKLVERSETKIEMFYDAFKSYTNFLAKAQVQQRQAERKLRDEIAALRAENS